MIPAKLFDNWTGVPSTYSGYQHQNQVIESPPPGQSADWEEFRFWTCFWTHSTHTTSCWRIGWWRDQDLILSSCEIQEPLQHLIPNWNNCSQSSFQSFLHWIFQVSTFRFDKQPTNQQEKGVMQTCLMKRWMRFLSVSGPWGSFLLHNLHPTLDILPCHFQFQEVKLRSTLMKSDISFFQKINAYRRIILQSKLVHSRKNPTNAAISSCNEYSHVGNIWIFLQSENVLVAKGDDYLGTLWLDRHLTYQTLGHFQANS